MNAKILGGGLVAVVAIGAVVYFGVLGKGGSNDAVAKERADKIVGSVKAKGGDATYTSATTNGDGVVLKDVVANRKDPAGKTTNVTIGEVRVNKYDWGSPNQPAYADVEYKKLRFPGMKDDAQFKEFATVTGLSEVVANIKFNYTLDKATKVIDLKTGDVEVEGMGTLSITGKIDGVDIAQVESMQGAADPGKLMGMLGAMRIHGLRISFKDAGGTAKVIKFGAHKEKKTEEQVRQDALAQVAQGKNAPFRIAREATTAAESFIKSPGTFTIEAKPKTPFAVAKLMTLMSKVDPAAIDGMTEEAGLTVKAQ